MNEFFCTQNHLLMRLMTIIMVSCFYSLALSAQLPQKAEDISPLMISEKVPEATLVSTDNENVRLSSLIQRKKTILLFYRGGWCPYCTAHLAAVGEVENEIADAGYQIIAISPDTPDKNLETNNKSTVTYQIYSDPGAELMQNMGIAFEAPERYSDLLSDFSDQQNPGILPVPSIFVLDTEGTIIFEYVCPDYKQRIEANLLKAIIKNLNNN